MSGSSLISFSILPSRPQQSLIQPLALAPPVEGLDWVILRHVSLLRFPKIRDHDLGSVAWGQLWAGEDQTPVSVDGASSLQSHGHGASLNPSDCHGHSRGSILHTGQAVKAGCGGTPWSPLQPHRHHPFRVIDHHHPDHIFRDTHLAEARQCVREHVDERLELSAWHQEG